jgi:hypothetical protein
LEGFTAYFSAHWAGPPTYEDLFSVLDAMESELNETVLNPALAPFISIVREQTEPLWRDFMQVPFAARDQFGSLIHEAQIFIQSVVRDNLSLAREPVGLAALSGICGTIVGGSDIVTLNHDTLIESELVKAGLSYNDGFNLRDGDARFFDEASLEDPKGNRLLKPHGSILWFRIRKRADWGVIDRYAIPDADPWHSRDNQGRWFDNVSGSPVFLMGTNNKVASYHSGIFSMQMALFRRILAQSNSMVCCGYGWKDRGINSLLSEWFWDGRETRILILHPDFDSEFISNQETFGHYSILLRRMHATNRFHVLPKWLSQSSPAEILSFLT